MEVILSHVCSKWRNIVINLPTLWTAFKFDTHLRVSDPAKKLEEYLFRSGKQLLELYFSFSSSDYGYDHEDEDEYLPFDTELFARDFAMVETVIAHAYRWHRFSLFADQFVPTLEFIDRFSELYVPNLEYLALCLSNFDPATSNTEDRGDLNPLILTGGAPRLYTIRIDTTSPFHSLPPLSNITTLAIQSTPDEEYFGFEFHIFHSILTIPTLTNLSIESFSCIEYDWRDDPVNTPRFKMPSLKTLRITQDSHVLGMLLFLDAPLLETLILHDVYLTSVTINQDIHKITTFVRLDTIALLDCQYMPVFGSLNQEDADRVDTILNTLACHATHLIISSQGSPFIERDSNLLDFNRYRWPRLQHITLDFSAFSDLMPYIRIFESSPQSITVRIVEPVFDQWARRPGGLTILEKVCRPETMKVGDPMINDPWPPPGGLFREGGYLENRFIWREIFRAKGPDRFLDE